MPAPGAYFAIYYTDAEHSFYRAARTWATEATGGVCTADSLLIEEMVATESDFMRAWTTVDTRSRAAGLQVVLGQVFSHASKGSSNDGLEFRPSASDDGTLAQSEILALPKLNWAENARLILSGCNTGLAGTRGWTPAGVFSKSQKVHTIGQAGYSYFSQCQGAYVPINARATTVYLWAYQRGKNGMFGSGGRMPGVLHFP